jgi:mRNA interferase RelE/StbE
MSGKNWSVELSRSSLKSLEKLDKFVRKRILNRLEELGNQKNPLRHKDVRPLEGKLDGFYRFRIGEYRSIFELDPIQRRLGVLAVFPRSAGY